MTEKLVTDFAEAMDTDTLRKAVNDYRYRSEPCLDFDRDELKYNLQSEIYRVYKVCEVSEDSRSLRNDRIESLLEELVVEIVGDIDELQYERRKAYMLHHSKKKEAQYQARKLNNKGEV